MNKDDFLSMVKKEYYRLEGEWYQVHGEIYTLKKNNLQGELLETLERRERILGSRKMSLWGYFNLPAYERIQTMSDIEIEDYKRTKINDLENEIKKIQPNIENVRKKYNNLNEKVEQYLKEYQKNHPSFSGRILDLPADGKNINQDFFQIRQYFEKLNNEIKNLKHKQEEIRTMTSMEIKQELSMEIEGHNQLAQQSEFANKPVPSISRLESDVAFNINESRRLASLETQYNNLSAAVSRGENDKKALKDEIGNQIKNFDGKTTIELSSSFCDTYDLNLEQIIKTSEFYVYRSDFINYVKNEAQNQADIREAELRGITVEQLKEMRKNGMLDELNIDNIDENQHGMKR